MKTYIYINIRFVQTKMFVLVTCIDTFFYIPVQSDSPSFVAFHPFSFDARSAPMCLCILHGEGAETLQATLELGRLEFSKTHSVLCEQILLSFTKASRSRVVGRQDSGSLVRGQEVSGLERWQHEENDCRLHQWNNVTRRLRKEVGGPDSGRGCGNGTCDAGDS